MSCVFSTAVCSDTFLQRFLAQCSSRLLANEEILWDEESRIKCVILCFLLFFLSFFFFLGFMRQHSKNSRRGDRRWHWKATITTFGTKLLSKFPLHFCHLKVNDEAILAAFGWQTLLRDDILLSVWVAICWWLLVGLNIAGSTKIDSTCPVHLRASYGVVEKRILPEEVPDNSFRSRCDQHSATCGSLWSITCVGVSGVVFFCSYQKTLFIGYCTGQTLDMSL